MPARMIKVAGVALACVVVAACAPYFASGSTLTTTASGPYVSMSWPAAVEDDDGQEVATYLVSIDGGAPSEVAAPATSCVLVGLDPNTTYQLIVTAVDTAGERSSNIGGAVANIGRVAGSVTTGTGTTDPSAERCVSDADADGDRLPDATETDTGTYVGPGNTGTDPALADTDGDAIGDGDEVLGTTAGLNLPSLGTKPTKKDLLLEFDWFDDNADPGECAAHSHRPTAAMISAVSTMYAGSPVPNPDGTTGVNFIADYGQGGAFTGGNLVPDADGVIAGGVDGADFLGIKASHFAANRNGYFRYTLMPHRYGTNSGSSGQAEIVGDDHIVSLYCYGSTTNVANTIAHELGHILGLRHGGDVNTNYKPNYNSVMNYQYQFPGVDTDCTVPGNGVLDYSYGSRASLNEAALLETDGICNGVDVDWNANLIIDAGSVQRDINQDGFAGSVHHDHNDWAAINFGGLGDGDGAAVSEPEIITDAPVPLSARN